MSQCRMPSRSLRFVHTLVLFLLPLCFGAVWSVAAQISGRELPWFALLVAASTVLMRDQLAFFARPLRALLHVAASAAGILYAQVLIAGVAVAGPFGYGLFDSLQRMGIEMTWALVVARCSGLELLADVAALALAATIGARQGSPRRRSAP